MNSFKYKAKDTTGKTHSGQIEAADSKQASKMLRDQGWFIIEIKQAVTFGQNIHIFGVGNVSDQEVANFTRYLSTMLSTGLPLTDCLSNLEEQASSELAEVIGTISRDVSGGSSLSNALSKHPNVFNSLYVNLIRAGEASGSVDKALETLADTLEKSGEFKGKVQGAMIYPVVVVIAMGGIIILMLTAVIPKISEVYVQFGAELPMPTMILINLSKIFTQYGVFTLAAIVIIYIAVFLYKRTPAGDYYFSNLSFKYPVLGKLNQETIFVSVCRTLGSLVGSGVSIIDALKIACGVVGNNVYRRGLEQAVADVERGFPLSLSLKNNENFPRIMSQMIGVGEETGTIDKSLERLAYFFESNAERKVKALTTAIEPILIIVMGIGVGGLAIAVLMPMFNLVNVIK